MLWLGNKRMSTELLLSHQVSKMVNLHMLAYFQKQYGMLNNIPTMQVFTGISRYTQSKTICYHRLSVSGNSGIMHFGIPIKVISRLF